MPLPLKAGMGFEDTQGCVKTLCPRKHAWFVQGCWVSFSQLGPGISQQRSSCSGQSIHTETQHAARAPDHGPVKRTHWGATVKRPCSELRHQTKAHIQTWLVNSSYG